MTRAAHTPRHPNHIPDPSPHPAHPETHPEFSCADMRKVHFSEILNYIWKKNTSNELIILCCRTSAILHDINNAYFAISIERCCEGQYILEGCFYSDWHQLCCSPSLYIFFFFLKILFKLEFIPCYRVIVPFKQNCSMTSLLLLPFQLIIWIRVSSAGISAWSARIVTLASYFKSRNLLSSGHCFRGCNFQTKDQDV